MNASINPSAAAQFLTPLREAPRIFPHQYNPVSDQVLLVDLDPAAQASASFLDERVLSPRTKGAWFNFPDIARAAAGLSGAPRGYIFHMGHCGSSLISRLVGAAAGAIGLREPLPLRSFATDRAEGAAALLGPESASERLSVFEALWARGPSPVIVKATSICTGLAGVISERAAKIFLYQAPEIHHAVLLAGANAAVDLRGFAQLRHKRLSKNFDLPPLAGHGPGELAALSWVCEAAAAKAASLRAFSFDQFLAAPDKELAAILSALSLEAPASAIADTLASNIMQQYSKAPEHAYDAALRSRVIEEARCNHKPEIARGMAWLEDFTRRNGAEADAIVKAFS